MENALDPNKLSKIRAITNDQDGKGKNVLSLCVDLTFFYRGGFPKNRDGILKFYEPCMEIIGDRTSYFLVDMEGRFKKAKPDTLEMLPFWANQKSFDRGVYGLILETSDELAEFSDLAFQTHNVTEHSGWSRMVLPVEFLAEQGVEKFVELAKNLASCLDFSSGTGGYALNKHLNYSCTAETGEIYVTSRRFIGIDVAAPSDFDRFVPFVATAQPTCIKGVNWLTFLDQDLFMRAGGENKLAGRFSKEVTIHELPNGIMIQAGPEPNFGDVNTGETLPLYREVGEALKSLLIPSDVLGPWNSIGGTENTRDWLHRFDNAGSE